MVYHWPEHRLLTQARSRLNAFMEPQPLLPPHALSTAPAAEPAATAESVLEAIIHQQLRLMARQLEVLRGSPPPANPLVRVPSSLPAPGAAGHLPEATAGPLGASRAASAAQVSETNPRADAASSGAGSRPAEPVPAHRRTALEPAGNPPVPGGVPVERDIDLGQIEAVLNQHPKILSSRVLRQKDGPGQPVLTAYLVERPEGGAEAKDEVGYWRGVWEGMHASSIVEAGRGGDPTHAFLRSI